MLGLKSIHVSRIHQVTGNMIQLRPDLLTLIWAPRPQRVLIGRIHVRIIRICRIRNNWWYMFVCVCVRVRACVCVCGGRFWYQDIKIKEFVWLCFVVIQMKPIMRISILLSLKLCMMMCNFDTSISYIGRYLHEIKYKYISTWWTCLSLKKQNCAAAHGQIITFRRRYTRKNYIII